ncbi:MAG: ABC transporter permease, partial [Balneolaceae bacterium]|nr:ABC transporter permease [Balneolaceae bacterium]
MFELEQAIQTWKRRLRSTPAFEDGDIAELESHLRSEVRRLKREGLTEKEAFNKALEEIGDPEPIGDELYKSRATQKAGPVPPWRQKSWVPALLPNYIKVSLRSFTHNTLTTLLNIGGLGIGVACFVIIGLYIKDELSYDRFHSKSDRIYRVVDKRKVEGVGEEMASTVTPAAEALVNDYPGQIKKAVRFFDFLTPSIALSYTDPSGENKQFNERRFFFTDPEIFTVFNFPLLKGDPKSALVNPYSVVLTEEMALKYFGEKDPIGRTIRFEGKRDLMVTGVLKNIPHNSHIKIDFLASFNTLDDPEIMAPRLRNSWIWNPTWTYLLLAESAVPSNLEKQLDSFVQKYFPESRRDIVELELQPLRDIHLHSHYSSEIQPNSDITYIYTFGAIAIIILLIAATNFINLHTAYSTSRAKEVGLRKTFGAEKKRLIVQFMSESMLLGIIAVLVAIPIIQGSLPLVNSIAGKELLLNNSEYIVLLLGMMLFGAVLGGLAGLYPAFVLSSFNPSRVLRGRIYFDGYDASAWLRKLLVTAQFSLLILLLIVAMVAHQQLNFLRTSEIGFEREDIVMVPIFRSNLPAKYEAFNSQIRSVPGVKSMTIVEDIPGKYFNTGNFTPEGFNESRQFQRLMTGTGITETLGLRILAGRKFRSNQGKDSFEAIVNRSMVEYLGWENPEEAIGKILDKNFGEQNLRIVGVVEDFLFTSLRQPIKPFTLIKMPDTDARAMNFFGKYLALRLQHSNITSTLEQINKAWTNLISDRPFDYFFLDQE